MIEYKIKKENNKYIILLARNWLGMTIWEPKRRLGTDEVLEFDSRWDASKYARRMNGIGRNKQ